MIDQDVELIFRPDNGANLAMLRYHSADGYRRLNPNIVWHYNPWTGEGRSVAALEDPYGLQIIPPFEELNTAEVDPHGKNPHELGAKMDAGKAPIRRGLLEYFPRACIAVAQVSASGAEKYAWNGWETVPDGVARYGDAEARHICKAAIEGAIDRDYGHLHAAHEAWNALARLELILREGEGK